MGKKISLEDVVLKLVFLLLILTLVSRGIIGLNLFEYAIVLLFAFFAVKNLLLKQKQVVINDTRKFFFFWSILWGATLLWSLLYSINYLDGITYLAYFVFAGMLCYVLTHIVSNSKRLHLFIKYYVIINFVIALATIISYYLNSIGIFVLQDLLYIRGSTIRASGLYGNPNYFSISQLINVGLILLYIKKEFYKKRYLIIILLISMFTIFITYSSGALISLIILILVYFLLNVKIHKLVLNFAVLFISVLILNFLEFEFLKDVTSASIEGLSQIESDGGNGRFDTWSYGLELFSSKIQYILFGVGANQFYFHSNGIQMHNSYFQILVETGIVGLFLWIALLVYVIKDLFDFKNVRIRSPFFYVLFPLLIFALSNDIFALKEFWLIISLIYLYNKYDRKYGYT